MSYFKQLVILFMLLSLKGFSQGGPPPSRLNFKLEGRIHYGIFLQHHFEMRRFDAHFPAFEISLQRVTFGQKKWESLYRYPMIGLSFWHSQLGKFVAIGEAYALYPFINFPLNHDMQHSLNFKMGVGLGYLTNRFDPVYNYQNFAIGSHLNIAVSMYFDYRLKVDKRSTWVVSTGLTHFSNGSTKTPNFGLNIFTVNTGWSWFLRKPNPYLDKKLLPELYLFEFDGKKWFSIELQAVTGIKDMSQETGQRHMIYNMAINAMKQISMRSKIGLGFDLTYDGSDAGVLERKNITYKNNWDLAKPGVNVAYEMLLDRTSFLFNIGSHIGGAELSEGYVYQKLAIKQLLSSNFFTTLSLTAHFGKADYIGVGFGYRLDFKYY